MSEQLAGVLSIALSLVLTDPDNVSTPKDQIDQKYKWRILPGIGANQADRVFRKKATLAASASEELDLVGALTDKFGNLFSPARVKLIFIVADAANTNTVVIGNAAATQFLAGFGGATHTWAIQPGQIFLVTAAGATAWPCATGSTDKFKVLNGGGSTSVTYTIYVVAASA